MAESRSVVCYAPGDYRIEYRPIPEVGEREVLVKVLAVGICASDVKCYSGANYYWGDESSPQYIEPPIVPGHEFIGEVVKLGKGAKEACGLAIGDHAISENIVPCWDCRYCNRGDYNMCMPHDVYGYHKKSSGGMTEYMIYPANSIVHKISKSVPPHHAAFTEPLACSVHAARLGGIKSDDVVVVSGCGSIALGIIAAVRRLYKPKTIIALDLYDWKLAIGAKCGADVTLNPTKCDAINEVRKLSDGFGCDVYIEATGNPKSVSQGLHMLCKQGTFVEYSVFKEPLEADWTIISNKKELTIRGGHLSPNAYPEAIRMIEEKALPLDSIVTHTLKLEEYKKGFDLVKDGSKSIKIVLLPHSTLTD